MGPGQSKYVPLGRLRHDGWAERALCDCRRACAPHVGDLGRARDGHGRPDAGADVRHYDGRFNQSSFCYERRKYTSQVLDGVIEDDSHFGIIFTLDEGDDEVGRGNWIKANPNLGISVDLDDLREQARKAKELPSALTSFLTKRLNIWTRAAEHFIHPDKWRACGGAFDVEQLDGRTCFAGLDLSNTLDITALGAGLSADGGRSVFPGAAAASGCRRRPCTSAASDQVPYDAWCRDGGSRRFRAM